MTIPKRTSESLELPKFALSPVSQYSHLQTNPRVLAFHLDVQGFTHPVLETLRLLTSRLRDNLERTEALLKDYLGLAQSSKCWILSFRSSFINCW